MKNFSIGKALIVIGVLIGRNTYSQFSWVDTGFDIQDQEMIVMPDSDSSFVLLNDGSFFSLDVTTGITNTLADYPSSVVTSVFTFYCFTADFLYAGFNTSTISVFAKYNKSTNVWTTLNPMLPLADGSINGGLTNYAYFKTTDYFYVTYTGTQVKRFNFSNEQWTTITGPSASDALLAFESNGSGCIVDNTRDVWQYNEPEDSWQLLYDSPFLSGWSGQFTSTSSELAVMHDTLYHFYSSNIKVWELLGNWEYNAETVSNNCRDFWNFNDTVYANFDGSIFRLVKSCLATATFDLPEGHYYRDSNIVLDPNEVIIPAELTNEFEYTWFDNGFEIESGLLRWRFSENTPGHEISLIAQSSFCSFYDTSYIELSEGFWNPIVSLPVKADDRDCAVALPFEEYTYLGLGGTDGYAELKDFWKFNMITKELTQVDDFPGIARRGSCAQTHEGVGYILGGQSGNTSLSDFWSFDPVTESWSQLPDFPGGGIAFGVSFISNDYLYAGLGGGLAFYKFDFELGNWTAAGQFNTTGGISTLYKAIQFEKNGQWYVGLGRSNLLGNNFHRLYQFDEISENWNLISSDFLPDLVLLGSWAVKYGEDIMIGGALNSVTFRTYLYDPLMDVAKAGPDPECANGDCGFFRLCPTTFVHSEKCYLAFGYNSDISDMNDGTLESVDNYGRMIFEFGAANCGVGGIALHFYIESPVGTPLPLHIVNSNESDFDNLVNSYFKIGNTTYPEGILPYGIESGQFDCLYLNEYNSCIDTFRFDVQIVCTAGKDSLDLFPGFERHDPAMWEYNGNVYIGVGKAYGSAIGQMWRYEVATGIWTQLSNFPGTPRTQAAAFRIDDKLYLCGGINEFPHEYSGTRTAELWEYSIATDTWTPKASYPNGASSGLFGYAYNGKGYVGCGIISSTSIQKKFYEYNPSSNSWIQLADYPAVQGLNNATVVLKGDTALIMGGYTYTAFNMDVWSTQTYAYLNDTQSWILIGGGPAQIAENVQANPEGANNSGLRLPAAIYGDRVYMVFINSIFSYNLINDSWTYHENLSEDVECDQYWEFCELATSGVQLGQDLYVFMRSDNNENNEFIEYNVLRKIDLDNTICSVPLVPIAIIQAESTLICDGGSVQLNSINQNDAYSYAWYLNNELIPNASDPSYTTSVQGNYQLVVTANGENATSEVVVIENIVIPDYSVEDDIVLNLCNQETIEIIAAEDNSFLMQWYLDSQPIFTGPTSQLISMPGNYQVEWIGVPAGCTELSPVWTIVDTPCGCEGDVDNNGFINDADVAEFLTLFGCFENCSGDLNYDGFVSTDDFIILIGLVGNSCE